MGPKILFVCYDGFRTTNVRVRCYRFSEQLNSYGLDTAVFSFKDSLHASYDGEDSRRVGFFERLSLLMRAIAKLMKTDKKTVFYVQKAGYFALAPLIVGWLKGNRLVLDYDDYEYEQSWLSKPLLELLARRAVFCVAASKYLQDLLLRFNKKVYYVPTGVDTDLFLPKARAKKKKNIIFTWVGIIVDKSALENVMMILDAFYEVEQSHPQVRLEILGAGEHMKEVESRLNHIKNSIYLGRLPPEKMPKYLDTVDVGLFVLAKDTKYNRSKSPTKLFEYMAKGLAVVATPIGEAGTVVADHKNGFIVHNKEELVARVIELAEKEGLAERIGKEAVTSVQKNYSLDVIGMKLKEIIEKELMNK